MTTQPLVRTFGTAIDGNLGKRGTIHLRTPPTSGLQGSPVPCHRSIAFLWPGAKHPADRPVHGGIDLGSQILAPQAPPHSAACGQVPAEQWVTQSPLDLLGASVTAPRTTTLPSLRGLRGNGAAFLIFRYWASPSSGLTPDHARVAGLRRMQVSAKVNWSLPVTTRVSRVIIDGTFQSSAKAMMAKQTSSHRLLSWYGLTSLASFAISGRLTASSAMLLRLWMRVPSRFSTSVRWPCALERNYVTNLSTIPSSHLQASCP